MEDNFITRAVHMGDGQNSNQPGGSNELSFARKSEVLLTRIAKTVNSLPGDPSESCESTLAGSFSINSSLITSSSTTEELSGLGVSAYSQRNFEAEAIQQFENQLKYQNYIDAKSKLDKAKMRESFVLKQLQDAKALMLQVTESNFFEVSKKKSLIETKISDLNSKLEIIKNEIDTLQRSVDGTGTNSLDSGESERERLIRIGEITPFENLSPNKDVISKHVNRGEISRTSESSVIGNKDEDSELSEYETDEEMGYWSDDFSDSKKKSLGDASGEDYEKRLKDLATDEENYKRFHEVEGLKIPEVIFEKLFKYQKTGVRWLWNLHKNGTGGILGDEMGLGKTIQIIAFLASLKSTNSMDFTGKAFRGLGPTIIICPATIVKQWVSEINKWWPKFRVAGINADEINAQVKVISSVVSSNGILVCAYSTVRLLDEKIVDRNWHYVILDEGHQIRNPDAKITLVCKKFKTNHRLILSGSPIQNNLKELWSIFDFIFPGKLGTLPAFQEHFAVPITQGGYINASHVQVQTAYRCACVLRDTISAFLLRRVKEDVKSCLTLPGKSEQVLFCRITDLQRDLYRKFLDRTDMTSVSRNKKILFSSLASLRKLCNHPILFESQNRDITESEIGDDGHWRESGKMVVVESLLRLWKKQNHKVLLFTQSAQMLRVFETFLTFSGYRFLKMDGKTAINSRQNIIANFNEDPGLFVFLLTTKTGGLGVNLVGANRVIIYDPDWNPGTDIQARERAWRIGQKKDVTIYRLVCSGTLEEKIYHRQIFKLFLTNRILKDPKQRRFFKTKDLHDLFTLDSGSSGVTETGSIFAGTGAEIERPSAEGKERRKTKLTPALPLKVPATSSLQSNKISSESKTAKVQKVEQQMTSSMTKKKLKRERSAIKSNIKQLLKNWNISPESEAGKRMIKKLKSSKSIREDLKSESNVDGGRIKGLEKVRKMKRQKQEDGEAEGESGRHDEDYILGKLFKSDSVQGAVHHDVIVDQSQGTDFVLVEKEAEKVARDAVTKLRNSQLQCRSALEGVPNWTGRSGFLKTPDNSRGPQKPKFGTKSSSFPNLLAQKPNASASSEAATDRFGSALMKGTAENSSSSILGRLKQRKLEGALTVAPIPKKSGNMSSSSSQEAGKEADKKTRVADESLMQDIVTFIKYHSTNPGEATTEELVSQFREELGVGKNAIFKAMLRQVCSRAQDSVTGKTLWTLNAEFGHRSV